MSVELGFRVLGFIVIGLSGANLAAATTLRNAEDRRANAFVALIGLATGILLISGRF